MKPTASPHILPLLAAGLLGVAGAGAGARCSTARHAPQPISCEEAAERLRHVPPSASPAPRPVVLLAGYRDPGLSGWWLERALSAFVDPMSIIVVSYPWAATFDECADAVVEEVVSRLGSPDPGETVPVDAIGVSMGGLVARHAATPREGRRRLRIVRLFTISTPHRGALSAGLAPWDPMARDMRAGSGFLRSLPEPSDLDYPIIPYVREDDWIVGTDRASPQGQLPLVVSARAPEPSHIGAVVDPRILLDIVLRLRGEEPVLVPTPHPPAAAGG